jgi:hypothetical protein
MSTENMIVEWRPTDSFNILDFRDFQSFPQYGIPPYVLKFRFSSLQEPLEIAALTIHFMGWNIPECRTDTLFSKVQVSKNGFQDIYYNQPGGKTGENNVVFQFEKKLVLRTPDDVLVVAFFPLCPVHMVDVDAIFFLTEENVRNITSTPPPAIIINDNNNDNNEKTKQNPIKLITNPQPFDHYWYIYATIFGMILLLLISLLFITINQPKKPRHYIVIRPKN